MSITRMTLFDSTDAFKRTGKETILFEGDEKKKVFKWWKH